MVASVDGLSEAQRLFVPTPEALIHMVGQCCPDQAPTSTEKHLMRLDSGRLLQFKPLKAMIKIARQWYENDTVSYEAKQNLLKLPWALHWLEENALCELFTKAATPGSGRTVSKDGKIEMLSIVYPANKRPHWRDKIPVRMGGGGGGGGAAAGAIWEFRPVQWLDDVANNWLQGRRVAVTLSEEQKSRLKKLPWFVDWLERLAKKRKMKRERERARMKGKAVRSADSGVEA